ncbi:MAG: hypothetical protein ACLQME_18195 [Alphaproteobacteria bacterium]
MVALAPQRTLFYIRAPLAYTMAMAAALNTVVETMGKFGKELIESMRQAAAHAGGRKVPGMRVTTVALPGNVGIVPRPLGVRWAARLQELP